MEAQRAEKKDPSAHRSNEKTQRMREDNPAPLHPLHSQPMGVSGRGAAPPLCEKDVVVYQSQTLGVLFTPIDTKFREDAIVTSASSETVRERAS